MYVLGFHVATEFRVMLVFDGSTAIVASGPRSACAGWGTCGAGIINMWALFEHFIDKLVRGLYHTYTRGACTDGWDLMHSVCMTTKGWG